MRNKERPVYSTDQVIKSDNKAEARICDGPCKMRLEKKGRAGKSVTVLFNLPFTPSQAKELMKKLQNYLGTGATFKNNTIEVRGDQRDKVIAFMASCQIKVINAGG